MTRLLLFVAAKTKLLESWRKYIGKSHLEVAGPANMVAFPRNMEVAVPANLVAVPRNMEAAVTKKKSPIVKLLKCSDFGAINITNSWEVTCKSGFSSVCSLGGEVKTGKWYYEVLLQTDGLMQIGWAQTDFFKPRQAIKGVGDDRFSWGYDGSRLCKWFNSQSTSYSHSKWKIGSIVGCAVDLDAKTMMFYLDGVNLGLAWSNVNFGSSSLAPAVSLSHNQKCKLIFLRAQLNYLPEGYVPLPFLDAADEYVPSFSNMQRDDGSWEPSEKLEMMLGLKQGSINHFLEMSGLASFGFEMYKKSVIALCTAVVIQFLLWVDPSNPIAKKWYMSATTFIKKHMEIYPNALQVAQFKHGSWLSLAQQYLIDYSSHQGLSIQMLSTESKHDTFKQNYGLSGKNNKERKEIIGEILYPLIRNEIAEPDQVLAVMMKMAEKKLIALCENQLLLKRTISTIVKDLNQTIYYLRDGQNMRWTEGRHEMYIPIEHPSPVSRQCLD